MSKIFGLLLLLSIFILTANSVEPIVVKTGQSDRVASFGAEKQIYSFVKPRSLLFLPENRIVIAEAQNLLLVSGNGKLIKKLYTYGQGPGELVYSDQVTSTDKQLIVLNSVPEKLVFMDLKGTFLKEIKLEPSKWEVDYRLIGTFKDQLIFHAFTLPGFPSFRGNKARIVSLLDKIELFDPIKKTFKNIGDFEVKRFTVFYRNRPAGVIPYTVLMAKPYKSKYLVLHHSERYIVKIMDLETKKIVEKIQPRYNRIPEPPDYKKLSSMIINKKKVWHPKREFFNDIEGLFTDEKYIYILTSTKDKKGKSRVDVYNSAFKLTKQIYLDQKKGILDFNNGFVFLREEDEDDNYIIGKYKIW